MAGAKASAAVGAAVVFIDTNGVETNGIVTESYDGGNRVYIKLAGSGAIKQDALHESDPSFHPFIVQKNTDGTIAKDANGNTIRTRNPDMPDGASFWKLQA